ncbi:MAG: phosphotyrosine protein phosphatase [Roseburia sp.]|nr:phosphotyrosine protein phosphatase [Roseburia sp.]
MDQYNRILFVCESGTARSPMAVGILKDFELKHPVDIESRGMVVLFPEPINQKVEAVLISNGVATNDFMSVQLTEEDFTSDTLILTMEYIQREKILEKYENVIPENIHVLTELVGDELEILDPYGGTLQSYGLCYETMRKSIQKLVNLLNED